MIILRPLVTFLAALLVSSSSCLAQDRSTYCRLSTRHTLCRFQSDGEQCGSSVSRRGVEDKNRQVILDAHNALRSIVASGQESRGRPGPQPQASNMQIMTWDEELATVAQRLAEQCLFEHDCNECRKVGRFPVGQNLAVEWTTGPPLPINWKTQVTRWYEEVQEFPNTSARKFEFSVVTGHYSQIIWADTNRVGCGFTSYRDNGTLETNLYVCNYGPAGNFIGLPSYKVGAPCSQCPANTACSSRFSSLCESPKKNPEISGESPSEELANEIVPGSTSRPVRPPPKVTTPTVSVTQRPTITTAIGSAVTKRPTAPTRPVVVTQRPAMKKPTAVTQGLIVGVTSRPPLFLATLGNNNNVTAEETVVVRKDLVCQVGRGACRAVFRGTAWNFRPQPFSMNQSYLETNLAVGELTELQISQNFPAPKANSHSCLSFQLRQEVENDQKGTSWLLPPLLIKIQPEKSQSVVVPISSGVESKWVQVKLAVSRIRTPFKLLFQQTGPTSTDETTNFSPLSRATLRLALGEMRIFSGSCKQ
ncbi:uncharacterized protein LOC124348961 isoform X2 [Daphnia pulicaria]|uniref:uncharacterized protein LOC124348961 isoform X2 n=1 Tax=Daphnia pulicaria TaxID=35523 RepID=UPI001EEB3B1E|nr:uncharacterized protein LOC124348961 isoform X2 [Daphnia pulicaria]